MAGYYIKTIWGPEGQNGYPHDNLIRLTTKEAYERFKKCFGFLIYEDGKKDNGKIGAKSIYACGSISKEQPSFTLPVRVKGKDFDYAVKVDLQKIANPLNGIPLRRVKEITGLKIFRTRGALLDITEEQFKELRAELDEKLMSASTACKC